MTTVSDVMHGEVVVADITVPLSEAIATMIDEEVGSLVITEWGQVIGILTERDVLIAVNEGVGLSVTPVSEVMSPGPFCAGPDDSLAQTVERMVQYGVQHMPVVVRGRPVGMLSARDLMPDFVAFASTNSAER